MLKIKPKQVKALHRLARDECCNCVDGNCLLLDDGDSHPCVQLISIYGVYCKYFRDVVLPLNEKLYAQIIEQNKKTKTGGRKGIETIQKQTHHRHRPRLR